MKMIINEIMCVMKMKIMKSNNNNVIILMCNNEIKY